MNTKEKIINIKPEGSNLAMLRPTEAILKIDNTISTPEALEIAQLYAEVFRSPPWNEAVKCDNCQQFQGPDQRCGSSCSCGGCLKEAYPLNETAAYLLKDSVKPGFRIVTATIEGQLAAFSWSYLTTPSVLAQSKWSTPEFQLTIVELLSRQGLDPDTEFRYLNETGVNPKNRNAGLASRTRAEVTGPETTVARTNCYSPMTAINYKQGFTQIMGPRMFVDRQSRVIAPTGEIANFLDAENPDRVLFIKTNL